MTKLELVQKINAQTGVDRATVSAVVESAMREIINTVVGGDAVTLRGFGTFYAKKRASKTGRDIKHNTTILIPERYLPVFKPSQEFHDIVIEKMAKGNKQQEQWKT